ncbi:ATP-binding cassette domain-containing protein [Rhodococcoides yunnanense]|uniref:ATP-binding cassette domain-containing protein n=1 Tax=Rhodococcoides yunnanense TaxID=278209 RepID=A0ABU4B8R0_9NOCA|nr:ATP-binding cassette domain-containing protein [Rhodococcus yunnanensis]MDV6260578.1 ATP-binding cassette domain-containing protein [Rhodococcus yunnanensis]
MLVVDDLCIDAGRTRIARHVSFEIPDGRRLGLLGASGSGKSMIASALVGALPPGITCSGRIVVDGHNVTGVPTPRRPPAARPAMVFQDSATALNPMVTVGKQLRTSDSAELLERVGLRDARRILASHPLELSGGQRQRVCIAVALARKSPLVIADEPTTALDVIGQARVLDALREVPSLLLITHDIAVAAQLCDHLMVLDSGRIVESGSTAAILDSPRTNLVVRMLDRARAADPFRQLVVP